MNGDLCCMGGTITPGSVDLARGERQRRTAEKMAELRQGNWHEAGEGTERDSRRPVDEARSTGSANIVTARATSATSMLPMETARHAKGSASSGSAKMPGRVHHRPLQRVVLKHGGRPLA